METGTAVNTPRGLGVVRDVLPGGKVIVKLLEDFRHEMITPGSTPHFYEFDESELTIALVSWGNNVI